MGGRGTFASGNSVKYTYQTVGYIDGVKVLQGIGNKHDLPVEAHASAAYIQLYPDGNFKMLRFFDDEHYLTKEIAYHPETDLYPSRKPILHIHEYHRDNFKDRTPRLLKQSEYDTYKKFFGGVTRWNQGT